MICRRTARLNVICNHCSEPLTGFSWCVVDDRRQRCSQFANAAFRVYRSASSQIEVFTTRVHVVFSMKTTVDPARVEQIEFSRIRKNFEQNFLGYDPQRDYFRNKMPCIPADVRSPLLSPIFHLLKCSTPWHLQLTISIQTCFNFWVCGEPSEIEQCYSLIISLARRSCHSFTEYAWSQARCEMLRTLTVKSIKFHSSERL